ncbi:MAG: DNA-processing protein DprA [Pseudomonadota bacterium]
MTGRLDLDAQPPIPPSKAPTTDETRLSWLRLARSQNVGPVTFVQLLRRYRSAADALAAVPDLAARGGAKRRIKICDAASAQAEIDAAATAGARMLCLGAPDYPGLLGLIDGAPPLIWALGNSGRLMPNAVALVGARNASAAGRRFAGILARDLAREGWVVVSGLARGVDGAAHAAALEEPGGTAAVLAGGVDQIYPPEHAELHAAIAEQGVVVSEMPMGFEPIARSFPRRNRIISGLSQGVLVIEAAERSGSLITARYAAEQGREAMAAPGHPLDPRAGGSNALLREGAVLIRSAEDVLEALTPRLSNKIAEPPRHFLDAPFETQIESDETLRRRLIELLSVAPVEVDELVRQAGAPAAMVASALLELELAGRIERAPGGLVSRVDFS